MPNPDSAPGAPSSGPLRGVVTRALSVITEVRPGEVTSALLLTLNVFLLLTAYYVIKPVRDALIVGMPGGAELKSYMSAAMTVLLIGIVPAYSAVANRVRKHRLVVSVTLFFAVNLLLFWLASSSAAVRSQIGLVFFVWVGIFNMMAVAQFWAFANDLYTEEQGKRLFALIGLGASVGAAVGSKVAELLISALGSFTMLMIAAGLLVLSAGLTQAAYRAAHSNAAERARASSDGNNPEETQGATGESSQPAEPASRAGGFSLVLSSKYLLLIAFFSLAFSMANTNGEYLVGKLFGGHAKQLVADGVITQEAMKNEIGRMYAGFYFWVNILGVTLQALVVSRLVKYGGLRLALLSVPVIALLSGLAIAVLPVLAVVRIGKTAENAADYSLNNTARQMLWLPTSVEAKYKAKQAVDAFFVRSGDVLSAGAVFVTAEVLSASLRGFAIFNLVIIALWLGLAIAIVREYARLGAESRSTAPGTTEPQATEPQATPSPTRNASPTADPGDST